MRLGDLDALKAKVALMFGDKTHITESVCELIDNAPTVAEDYDTGYQDGLEDGLNDIRPQGKWICEYRTCKCSVCSFATVVDTYNFCPNCGADMRGEEE